VYTVS